MKKLLTLVALAAGTMALPTLKRQLAQAKTQQTNDVPCWEQPLALNTLPPPS